MGEGRQRAEETETERTRGVNVFGGEGSGRSPSSPLTTLCVQSGQLCVWRGRRVVVCVMANRLLHSKRRKKKALFFDQSFVGQNERGNNRGAHVIFLLSYVTAPSSICPPFGPPPPQKRGHGVEIRKNGGHLTVL